jgi:hypothetical protein
MIARMIAAAMLIAVAGFAAIPAPARFQKP